MCRFHLAHLVLCAQNVWFHCIILIPQSAGSFLSINIHKVLCIYHLWQNVGVERQG